MTTLEIEREKLPTERLQELVLSHLREGSSRAAAYRAEGVSDSTFYTWIERDTRGFADRVAQAEAEGEEWFRARLKEGAEGGTVWKRKTVTRKDGSVVVEEELTPPDWRAAESVLKRRYKQEWSELIKQELTGKDGGAIEIKTPEDKLADLGKQYGVREEGNLIFIRAKTGTEG